MGRVVLFETLECFRKSGNRFSDKKYGPVRVLPEKWEPVFR